ncbi:MAG TPA: response regulator transcription factor, partial [Opitutaceae bacterium]|nr:response regulator transcription factor [Opitutaceae bacterium]
MRRSQTPRVAIIEGHTAFAAFLAALCQQELGGKILFSEKRGRLAIGQVVRRQPDLVLIDVSLPDISGWEVARCIHLQAPHVRLLLLTAYQDTETVRRAREVGALGLVDKRLQNRALLAKAIRWVSSGKCYFGGVTPELPQTVASPAHQPRNRLLSEIEQSALVYFGTEMSDEEIAPLLGWSIGSV